MKLFPRNKNYPLYIIFLLFAVDLSTYFVADIIPVSVMKVFVCGCAFLLMCRYKNPLLGTGFRKMKIWKMIVLYMLMLIMRIFVDFILPWKGFFLYNSPLTIVFFIIMTMIIPMFFFGKRGMVINTQKWCIITGFFLCLCLLMSLRSIFSGEAYTSISGQHSGEGTVDIISYGHYGCTLILLGVYIFLEGERKSKIYITPIFILIGLSAIVLSGSRSPVLALAVCGVLLFVSRTRKTYLLPIYIFLLIIIVSLMSTAVLQFNSALESKGIVSFNRIVEAVLTGGSGGALDTSGRDDIFSQGWMLFLDNMLFGASYLLPDQSYVHNIFIEQFMALGLFGGTLFVVMNYLLLRYSWKLLKTQPKDSIFPILYIQFLIYGLFSRTIIAIIPYWLFMFVTLNIYYNKRIKNGISNNPNI